jgi:hypothetical protein
MFNADLIAIKQPLRGMSALKFVGSRLITKARYLSAWTVPELHEVWRIRGNSDPITIASTGQLILSRLRHEYQVVDITSGEIVGVCPNAAPRYDGQFALSRCGRFIIAGEQDAIRVREVGSGSVVWERKLEQEELRELCPLQRGARWAFCIKPIYQFGDVERPTVIEVWDWPLGSQPRSVRQQDFPFASRVSEPGLIALPGYRDKPIRVLDLESGRVVREFSPPKGNKHSGYAHWLSDDRLALAWENVLIVAALNGPERREFHLPTYSYYSVAATDELLALSYHDGFVLLPFHRLPESGDPVELSPPWEDPPEADHGNDEDHAFVTPTPASVRPVVGQTPDELRAALKEFERPAWIPQVRFNAGEVTSSKLGGTAWISESEAWPCCPVCSSPMELFLQLNSNDLPAELADRFSGLLQVFLCVTDGYSTGTCGLGYEGFSKASMLRICNPDGPPRYQRPPFADAFIEGVIESLRPHVDLPSLQELVALGIELSDSQERLMINQSERFALAGDKLGGWPDWPQNLDYIACPRCARRMDVIFQIDSGCALPHCFMDGGMAWVSQCKDHPDVIALNWNS